MRRTLVILSLALFYAVLAVGSATAHYPDKPVRLVVPFSAGGPSDAAARTLGKALSNAMGQPIVIENMPGANGAIAARAVRTSAPDGYTLLWGVGSMVAIPLLQKGAPLEVLGNFAPVSIVGQFTFGMVVNSAMPAKTIDEFVKFVRANPNKISVASASLGEFKAATQFMKASGIVMTRVPYKGGAQAVPDLLAERVQVLFAPVSVALPHVRAGQLRMLGILLPQRSPVLPEVPTMTEAGMPGVSVPSWQAIFAPPNTPRDVVDRMSEQVKLVLQDSDVATQLERLALKIEGAAPDALAAVIRRDVETWQTFIRENDIPQQ